MTAPQAPSQFLREAPRTISHREKEGASEERLETEEPGLVLMVLLMPALATPPCTRQKRGHLCLIWASCSRDSIAFESDLTW